MKKKGRKQLVVRKSGPFSYHVGYWDRSTGDPIRDFRSCGVRKTEEEAKQLQIKLSIDKGHWYYL